MLELKQIGVQFGDKSVLKDISITFQPGEIIGLVAPNGTGKSTLMNVIMNYLSPNHGKVILNKKLQYSNKANEVKIHQAVSMMPDQSDLYNHVSGKNHLRIYQAMWNSDPKLIEDTIIKLGMESYVKKKTGTYSLGMRQRLCFAMQIVSDTQIMLMDEVMNGLDPTHVELISQILLQKKAEGKIIIIASHLLENLEQYADRIFFMKNGELKLVDELVPGFTDKKITTVRVSNFSPELLEVFKNKFSGLHVQTLPSGKTLIDVSEQNTMILGDITQYLIEQQLTDFSFGKLKLNDLYSMEYQPG
ncbi:ATP-binding cassette domain-containing protein [Psychrobacillus sp. INOP01]|uniref:ABC transporter ATP-binding protein n=1 Tax=Psychrobacillus sp. INOP01 TaxID=2829187 RepID=UPI001BAE54CF|nr:ATP-binding cassette domain-containing protein [Psychrobacillus sp. INOP01]QUG43642.1 ATP-binding cassette domain-containing protein [Psychrobacillus sp. INOP01]